MDLLSLFHNLSFLNAKAILFVALCHVLLTAQAQVKSHATWQVSAIRLNDTEALLSFHAVIKSDWHIYSQHVSGSLPMQTHFEFTESSDYEKIGIVKEESAFIESIDPIFGMPLKRFERTASFTQRIKLTPAFALIRGSIRFMACSQDECGPVETLQFSVSVKVRDQYKITGN